VVEVLVPATNTTARAINAIANAVFVTLLLILFTKSRTYSQFLSLLRKEIEKIVRNREKKSGFLFVIFSAAILLLLLSAHQITIQPLAFQFL
jgi:hypothetical protein